METSASALATLGNIFLDPKQAFNDIRGHASWLWYPLLLSLVLCMGIFAWYYATADWDGIVQQTMDYIAGRNYPPETLEKIRTGLTRGGILAQTAIFTAIFIVIVYLIEALYLFMASKLGGYEVQGYGQWFSFVAWTNLPGAVAFVVMGISYLFAGKHANLLNLDVTSLNTLLFKLKPGDNWFGLANSLHLTSFWVWGLMVVGFAQWTRQSLGKSAVITLAPYALIYGIWALVKLI
jgi:hypothetical protein